MQNPKNEEKIHKNWKGVSWKESAQSLYKCLTEFNNTNSEKVKNALTWCELVLKKDSDTTTLTSQLKVITSKVVFRIIPYDADENYFSDDYDEEFKENAWFIVNSVHQPAFWVFMHLYAPLYQPVWTNNIEQSLQLFFNLNA